MPRSSLPLILILFLVACGLISPVVRSASVLGREAPGRHAVTHPTPRPMRRGRAISALPPAPAASLSALGSGGDERIRHDECGEEVAVAPTTARPARPRRLSSRTTRPLRC